MEMERRLRNMVQNLILCSDSGYVTLPILQHSWPSKDGIEVPQLIDFLHRHQDLYEVDYRHGIVMLHSTKGKVDYIGDKRKSMLHEKEKTLDFFESMHKKSQEARPVDQDKRWGEEMTKFQSAAPGTRDFLGPFNSIENPVFYTPPQTYKEPEYVHLPSAKGTSSRQPNRADVSLVSMQAQRQWEIPRNLSAQANIFTPYNVQSTQDHPPFERKVYLPQVQKPSYSPSHVSPFLQEIQETQSEIRIPKPRMSMSLEKALQQIEILNEENTQLKKALETFVATANHFSSVFLDKKQSSQPPRNESTTPTIQCPKCEGSFPPDRFHRHLCQESDSQGNFVVLKEDRECQTLTVPLSRVDKASQQNISQEDKETQWKEEKNPEKESTKPTTMESQNDDIFWEMTPPHNPSFEKTLNKAKGLPQDSENDQREHSI